MLTGLQSLLSVQSSYQLSKYSAAGLAFTYQPAMGPGLQVTLLLCRLLILYSRKCALYHARTHARTHAHKLEYRICYSLA